MYSTLFLAIACSVGLAHAQIDYSNCVTVSADKGRNADCPSGMVSIGVCTSGRLPDCSSGQFTEVKCCSVAAVEEEEQKACSTQEGRQGSQLTCPGLSVVNSVCSSGAYGDCGNNVWNRISCCDNTAINPSTNCAWLQGNKGVLRECPSQNVVRGVCSSGQYEDCNIGGYKVFTGIYCCPY